MPAVAMLQREIVEPPVRQVRAYWQEIPPETVFTWRARRLYLLSVLGRYDIDGRCLIRDLGWEGGWEIAVGFERMLHAREWWRREKDDDDARLPREPQF